MSEITDAYKRLGNVDEVATELGQSRDVVTAEVNAMPDRELHRRRGRSTNAYTEQQLIECVQLAAEIATGNESALTVADYRALAPTNGLPSVDVLTKVFGSWALACERAEVMHNPQVERKTRFTIEDSYPAIRQCTEELGRRPSFHQYDRWAKMRDDVPSGATIRSKHRGKWSPAIQKAFEDDSRVD